MSKDDSGDPIITELNTTYDTNLLDIKSEEDQVKYINSSIMNINKGKGNRVIEELTYNHYTKYKPKADFIGGPKSLSIHWHPEHKKLIYIFGEWHTNTMDCKKFRGTNGIKYPITVPVEDYLYDLMKSTDVFLDIYFEFPFHTSDYDYYWMSPPDSSLADRTRLQNLFNKFKKCLVYDSRHAKSCQLARVHYFDIRTHYSNPRNLEENKIDIVWIMEQLYLINYGINLDFAIGIDRLIHFLERKIVIDILIKLTDIDNQKIFAFIGNQLKENRYIKKELSKIVYKSRMLNTAIYEFFYDEIEREMKKDNNINRIKGFVNLLLHYRTMPLIELRDALTIFINCMSSIIVCFADAYLIARVFKDFNMTEMEKKAYKGATHQPNRAHNIIIYAGDTHANNYRNFLSYVGFTEIDSSGIDPKEPYIRYYGDRDPRIPRNCLDMRTIKQPFFEYKRYDKKSFDVIKRGARRPVRYQ